MSNEIYAEDLVDGIVHSDPKQEVKKDVVTHSMRKLAKEKFQANKLKNQYTRDEKKASDELFKEMKEAGLKEFSTTYTTEAGNKKTLTIKIEATEKAVVDISILEKLVDAETFRKIISATQASVKEYVGENIKNQVLKYEKGEDSLKVTEK